MKITIDIKPEDAAILRADFWHKKSVEECIQAMIQERAEKARETFGKVSVAYELLLFRQSFPEYFAQVEAPTHNGVGEGDSQLPG
jgi:hypothetical protein